MSRNSSGIEVNGNYCANAKQKYRSVVEMDPVIEKNCNDAKDLEEQLAIGAGRKLPKTMLVPTLLNPMFGMKPKIVGAGIMTGNQYDTVKMKLLCMLQDILYRKSLNVHEFPNQGSACDSDEDLLPD